MADVYLEYEYTEVKSKARGVVIEGQFVFPAHCANCKRIDIHPFGPGFLYFDRGELLKREIRLRGYLLRKVYFNKKDDVAIYKLPKELDIPNFPCAIKKKINLGEKVFIIGNPLLSGLNIRQGNISSVISLKAKKDIHISNTFSIDTTAYPGDSGSPIVSADYKLVGITVIAFGPDITCVKYIKKFTDSIK